MSGQKDEQVDEGEGVVFSNKAPLCKDAGVKRLSGSAKEWCFAIRPPCVKGAVSRRLTGGLFLYTNCGHSVDNLSLKSANDPSVTLRVTAPLAQGSLVKGTHLRQILLTPASLRLGSLVKGASASLNTF